jgi:hypothetical protein
MKDEIQVSKYKYEYWCSVGCRVSGGFIMAGGAKRDERIQDDGTQPPLHSTLTRKRAEASWVAFGSFTLFNLSKVSGKTSMNFWATSAHPPRATKTGVRFPVTEPRN